MNEKRLLIISLVLAIMLSACGSATSSEQVATPSRLDRVRAAGEVRIGVRNDNPPLSYVDPGGEWIGFDVDLAQAMADHMGLEVELVVVDETTRISFLQEEPRVDFKDLAINLGTAQTPVLIRYGAFLQTLIDFAIIAFVLFLVIKGMIALKRRFEKEEAAAPPKPTQSEVYLKEIRDALVKK